MVLFATGWGPKRSFDQEYQYDWPYLTGEAAQWLRDKGIKGVGIDAMSMGGWYEGTGRPAMRHCFPPVFGFWRRFRIPDELTERGECYLMTFPLKLQGFSGAPARAVAAV